MPRSAERIRRLSPAQRDVLARLAAGERLAVLRAGDYRPYWSGRRENAHAGTVGALVDRGLIADVGDPAWQWRSGEYALTDAGRAALAGGEGLEGRDGSSVG